MKFCANAQIILAFVFHLCTKYVVSLCLSVLPRCLNVMILVSFQTDRYMQKSVDPDQTPVPSGLPFCLHLFGSLCRKMIPIKNGGCSFSYVRI